MPSKPDKTTHRATRCDRHLASVTPTSFRMRGKIKKSKYGCAKCERGFHVECFSAFHYQYVFIVRYPALREALDAVCRSTTVL
ncbi:hypothetical protein PC115_g16839 [Phytophthora cactorum]|uniref:Uncharacterized protein n=1 Tax=Phytophthora cactorum TaxID=29920 RepID=A0A8T1BA09_9STRA|nr:hypothetical protein PC115_g16839 [Phytophthora cactorum]